MMAISLRGQEALSTAPSKPHMHTRDWQCCSLQVAQKRCIMFTHVRTYGFIIWV